MAGRKLPKEVQAVFDKYTHNFVRRLKKPEAVKMFVNDYKLSEEHAHLMFDIFDIDKNGELSIWEYQQFYSTIGSNVQDVLGMFQTLQRDDGSGNVDMERTWEAMKEVKTMSGRVLEDNELEKFLKMGAGEEKEVNLQKFISIMCRIKQFRG